MLKVDSTLNHIPARREHVIALYESINQPLVNIPNFGTAATGAFVLGTRNDQGYYTVFVYLYQAETRAVVIYVSEPRALTNDQYRMEESEGVRFVESMGFMIDNVHFPTLAPPEQETVMGRVPLFRPPERTVDLYELAEERPRPQAFAPPPITESLDALFGGLSMADGDVFRRAGLPPSNRPGPASNRPTTPGLGQPPMPPLPFGQGPSFGMGGNGAPSYSTTPLPSMPLSPAAGLAPLGFVQGPPGASFGPPPERPAPTAEGKPDGLDRLGRLLGAFGLLVALALSHSGCKTGGASDGDSPVNNTIEANIDLGDQQIAQGRWPDAIQSFQLVLAEDEKQKDALRGSGLAYLNLGRLNEAEAFYRRAIEADPKFSIAKNELAVVLMSLDRCADAEPLLQQVLEDIFYTTPEYAEHNMARAIACQGRVGEAITRLEKLLTRRPYFCLGYLTLAQLSSQAKQPEVTIGACDDFSRNCENHAEIKNQVSPEQSAMCYLQKGMAHAALGDVESARASFERCQTVGAIGKECRRSLEMLHPQ